MLSLLVLSLQTHIRDQLIAMVSPSGSPVLSEDAVCVCVCVCARTHTHAVCACFFMPPIIIFAYRTKPRQDRGQPRVGRVTNCNQYLQFTCTSVPLYRSPPPTPYPRVNPPSFKGQVQNGSGLAVSAALLSLMPACSVHSSNAIYIAPSATLTAASTLSHRRTGERN